MAAWRLARCLSDLRDEMDTLAPDRSKASDGTIGDARHQAEHSDHNPNDLGVVCAFDITHDPAHGADMGVISEFMRTHRHPSLTYLIFDRRIASSVGGWAWRPYNGLSPHTEHLHVSASHDYDNPASWGLSSLVHAADHGDVTPTGGFLMPLTDAEVEQLQADVTNTKKESSQTLGIVEVLARALGEQSALLNQIADSLHVDRSAPPDK